MPDDSDFLRAVGIARDSDMSVDDYLDRREYMPRYRRHDPGEPCRAIELESGECLIVVPYGDYLALALNRDRWRSRSHRLYRLAARARRAWRIGVDALWLAALAGLLALTVVAAREGWL